MRPGEEINFNDWIRPGEEINFNDWMRPGEEINFSDWMRPGEEINFNDGMRPGEEINFNDWSLTNDYSLGLHMICLQFNNVYVIRMKNKILFIKSCNGQMSGIKMPKIKLYYSILFQMNSLHYTLNCEMKHNWKNLKNIFNQIVFNQMYL